MEFSRNHGLALSSLFWICAVLAAFAAGLWSGMPFSQTWIFALVGISPALISILLWPYGHREWAQAIIILIWIAFAIFACFATGFFPMALVFLCAPLSAALFEREKVVEALLLSALFAAVVFFAEKFGYAPTPIANALQIGWANLAAGGAVLAFLVGAMYFASSHENDVVIDDDTAAKLDFANIYPGMALKFAKDGMLVFATDRAVHAFGLQDKDYNHITLADLGYMENERQFFNARANNAVMSDVEDINANVYYDVELVSQDDGTTYAFASDCSDLVNKLQKLEEAQVSAAKNAADKTLFFAGVSHELRTPLNAIIGFSDMMRSRLFGPLPGKYADYANLIHDSGQHMLDLIGDVLDMSKVEAGKYELNYDRFDMGDVIRSSLKMVRPSADAAELTLAVDIEVNTDLLISADRRAVRQILLNLLSNAIKFTPKGGRILVSAKIVNDVMNLSVEDNGTGMSAQDLENIGTAYVQADNAMHIDARGSGLGLSLVKNLVALHGGRTVLNSQPDQGTTVDIYLPIDKIETF